MGVSTRQRTQAIPAGGTIETGSPAVATCKGFLDLPAELIEDILVALAESANPKTIAALARTCRAVKKLIYFPEDKHLWRRIFLTTFDDPRLRSEGLDDHSYDWAHEYQSWMRALHVFERRSVERLDPRKRALRQRPASADEKVEEPRFDYTGVLEALLSTLHSTMPVPPPGGEEQRHAWEDPSMCTLRLREAAERAPDHPPYFQSSQEHPKPQPATATATESSACHFIPPSKNITFLKRVFSLGVIPDLLSNGGFNVSAGKPILFHDHITPPDSSSSPAAHVPEIKTASPPAARLYATSERDALNQLIAVFGISPFLVRPTPSDAEDTLNMPEEETTDPEIKEEDTLYRPGVTPLEHRSTFVARAFSRIRLGAQTEVYRMRYLDPRRAYGPFLRVPMDDEDEYAPSDEDDAEDGDYVPRHDHDDSDDDDAEFDADAGPVFVHIAAPRRPRPLPSAADLRADWEHLAAIRIVVQARMEETMKAPRGMVQQWFQHGKLDDLQRTLLSWENVRAGVWSAGPKDVKSADACAEASGSSSLAQESTIPKSPSEPLIEWDWAGVQGVWRRAVCWLDYHALIYHNVKGFAGATLDEATITVPMTLRVTGFSPSPSPQYKGFPTIHFDSKRVSSNTMGGAGWLGDGDGEEDVRRVKGTVTVCGDGSIWWSMLSSQRNTDSEWEWSSEGVQIGPSLAPGVPTGMRSGCGVLGLWTGWEHEPEDPIGAWWQWRVV
ncbi:hypothetical protein PHLGIDRAFT_200529 [Phlebiopsis gigantea 11061_1 CR5-6]|uniref:F-box domain-containing protein n=1 Tax=Phlebiopsis gigantea (strain 11061_1 CR5-6) TaxID=745531 RepID=A0A0C3S6W1_PHLG1|nr:hypothetical protein PHLGIDRAFT_200529 [Phlebiopsis gigantea 11061_1 CR5-6]